MPNFFQARFAKTDNLIKLNNSLEGLDLETYKIEIQKRLFKIVLVEHY